MTLPDRRLFRLTFSALESDIPEANRLRQLLKRLLRAYGFRATGPNEGLEELKPPPPAKPDDLGA
jgi:hypothetical protein